MRGSYTTQARANYSEWRVDVGVPVRIIGLFHRFHAISGSPEVASCPCLDKSPPAQGVLPMKAVSQLLDLLKKAGRSLLSPPTQDIEPALHGGKPGRRSAGRVFTRPSQFLSCTFECQAGSREYRLFVPSCYAGRPLPLIIMLHGCKQTPEDFAAGTGMNDAAEAAGLLVAYPAQTRAANRMHCWNWFQARHQKRGEGEPAIIAGITREIMQHYAVDARQVYVAGLSAGGSMAAVMGNTYPELYAAIGVHSGLAYRGAENAYSAIFAMQRGARIRPQPERHASAPTTPALPAIVFHGENDRTVHPDNGSRSSRTVHPIPCWASHRNRWKSWSGAARSTAAMRIPKQPTSTTRACRLRNTGWCTAPATHGRVEK